jgi:hypothetical protein
MVGSNEACAITDGGLSAAGFAADLVKVGLGEDVVGECVDGEAGLGKAEFCEADLDLVVGVVP